MAKTLEKEVTIDVQAMIDDLAKKSKRGLKRNGKL